ncbi:MAG TPA: pyruvate kinase, partial [Thermoplasmata archaeon]|nr:pyruvate kinase [Thermoplasmata archaeon]
GSPSVTVPRNWLLRRHLREQLELRDARRARRVMRLVEHVGGRYRAEVEKTCYLTSGTRLVATLENGQEDETSIGPVPRLEQRIRLRVGDTIVVTSRAVPGEDAEVDPDGRVRRPAHIACTAPETLRFVRRDEPIWFDDGRIGGVVRSAHPDRLIVEVTHAPEPGAWLGADKGINFPDTTVDLPAIAPKDQKDLRFIAHHADLVGYSFVHRPEDIALLRQELKRLGRPRMGVLLKIETRTAFEELPGILLAALRQPPTGVMIARGDLAVEVGYERLAEVQEEILWLCEAAHIPAVWATQVLEGLTKTGLPTRAEVTDAAMGVRAECVMLNKGPHVVVAVRALDSILRRMQSHQAKKTAMLRHLNVVERFFTERTAARRR